MTTRTASCSCGQLNLACEGDPVRVSMCHCLECQKRTGSAFGLAARYERPRVKIEGRASEWQRRGDEGSVATFRFCPVCGANVYWTNDGMPDVIAVAVGAFADPAFPAPMRSVYEERQHPWTRAIAGMAIERMD